MISHVQHTTLHYVSASIPRMFNLALDAAVICLMAMVPANRYLRHLNFR